MFYSFLWFSMRRMHTYGVRSFSKSFFLSFFKKKNREKSLLTLSSNESIAMISNHDSTRNPSRDSNRGSTGSNGSRDDKPFVPQKDRPNYTHCGLSGHTVDKCYKIHRYPLGYKPKSRNPDVNQATASQSVSNLVLTQNFPFSQEQCKQLITFLQTQSNVPSLQTQWA